MLNNQQQAYHQQWRDMLNADSMASVSEMTQQNIERWNEMQRELLQMYGLPQRNEKGLSPKPSNSPACITGKIFMDYKAYMCVVCGFIYEEEFGLA